MKKESTKHLCNDILAGTLARSRQRRRWGTAALASTGLLTCACLLCLQHSPPHEKLTPTTSQSSEMNPSAPNTESTDEFDPLLELLADAGPIIITLPNGDRELILTR